MSIFIGSSCCGYGNTVSDCTVNEIRFVIKTDIHSAHNWEWVDRSLASRTKMIINIESHTRGWNKGWESEANLRSFTEEILTTLIAKAYNNYGITLGKLKRFCRLTFDNEANEIYSPYEYGYYLDIFYSQVAGRFDIGAGNFGNNRKDYFEYICRVHKTSFSILDIHMQNGWETKSKIAENAKWYRELATKYVKRISCTEANDTRNNIWTASGFGILHYQLVKAIEIGAEDFCMIFIKQPDDGSYANQSFIRNNGSKSPYWDSFKKMIGDNKPVPIIIEPIIISEEDMELKLLGLNHTRKGQQVKWLQDILLNDYKVPNSGGIDGKLGEMTDKQIRDYQEEKELKIDGIVGENTTMKLINESSDPKKWMRNLIIYMSYE
ncbi:hypothetical protein ES705_11209 [subsurface metagenome]